jgi:DNA mismatch repair ATPase MutS
MNISDAKFNIFKLGKIGKFMKQFYRLYDNVDIKKSFIYSFGFHGYIDNIIVLNKQYEEKRINECKFSQKKKYSKFKNAYYPVIDTPIKNSYKLDKNILITGPNAAGKTTILKTTLFNILFSQQTGMGFYSKAIITPYSHLHSYLNIPDTMGRDSLFQSEARRCKNIIDTLQTSDSKELHFCIFDELYSGTNPYEAISSSVSLLKYLSKYNINYILTTHYLDVCKKLDKDNNFINYHMDIEERNEDFVYTYKLTKGISHIKGGIKVLNDLNYPHEIIDDTKKLIHEVNI